MLVAAVVFPFQVRAQLENIPLSRILLIGSPDEDRLRLRQVIGVAPLAGSLIRSPSASQPLDTTAGASWSIVAPVVDATWNSQIPFSLDDGNLWAGRGLSARLAVGLSANYTRFHVLLVPDIQHVENSAFNLLPSTIPGRSAFASPFQSGAVSADIPTRFGNAPFTVVSAGQSALWANIGQVDVGASTENQWWGPALQNALVMSNNAPGIPEVFARTNRPWITPIGAFEAKLMTGELTESLFFDQDSSNDVRAISGVVATYAPAIEPRLTFGATRVVYSPIGGIGGVASHALDALVRWSTTRSDSLQRGGIDQLGSLFARWVFPESGVEVYAEWSRMLLPVSFRDFLIAPQFTQGYTIGGQATGHIRPNALLRFQAEFTNLEQTSSSIPADTLSFYTSRGVPQGYTQRGQVVGAPIGPGSSSQLMGVDYMPPLWDVGLFAERIRWNNDAYYLQPTGVSFFSHDVTILGGVRGTVHIMNSELHAELGTSQRLNFMFQNVRGGFGPQRANDVDNTTLRVWWSAFSP